MCHSVVFLLICRFPKMANLVTIDEEIEMSFNEDFLEDIRLRDLGEDTNDFADLVDVMNAPSIDLTTPGVVLPPEERKRLWDIMNNDTTEETESLEDSQAPTVDTLPTPNTLDPTVDASGLTLAAPVVPQASPPVRPSTPPALPSTPPASQAAASNPPPPPTVPDRVLAPNDPRPAPGPSRVGSRRKVRTPYQREPGSRASVEKANREAWNSHVDTLKKVLEAINGSKRRTKMDVLWEAAELARRKNSAATTLAVQLREKQKKRRNPNQETAEEKRLRINASEQARRDESKNAIEALKAAVPALACKDDCTKVEILATATQYLRESY